jgi:hypothetical protein
MNNLSNYAEKKLIDHLFKVASYTPATNIYIGLHTADPTDAGNGAEVSGNNYSRVACNVWNAASNRASANTGDIVFPEASVSWGTVTHFSLWDNSSAGNLLAHGQFGSSKVIGSGNVPTIAAGGITITFEAGVFSTYAANKLLDHLLKTAAFTVPTNLALGFSTADPTDAGSGVSEPSGNNYSRTVVNSWDAANATTGLTANTNAITGPVASGSWGTLSHLVIYDNTSGGNLLVHGALGSPQTVGANDWLEFAAGALTISLN